jgi:hypothetical protein
MPSLESLLFGVKRSLEPVDLSGQPTGDAIIPDVTISEQHSDTVTVTSHPVDVGCNINDHAYKDQSIVTCVFGWSDSSRLVNSALDGSIFRGIESVNEVYEKLIELQDARMPIRLSTSKRVYPVMLITKVQTSTTSDTENSALIEVTFQEIMIATAKTVSLASIQQKNPKRTAGSNAGGQRNPRPVSVQLLRGARSGRSGL